MFKKTACLSVAFLLTFPLMAWGSSVDGQVTALDGYSKEWVVTISDGPGGTQYSDGRLYTFQDTPTSDLFVAYKVSEAFVDNSYGDNASACWGAEGHTFNDVLKSDGVGFTLKGVNGSVLLSDTELLLDYLGTYNTGALGVGGTVFYRSGGVVQGKANAGPGGIDSSGTVTTASKGTTQGGGGPNTVEGSGIDVAMVPLTETSLGRNMSLFPTATTDSSMAAGWENAVIYEFMIASSVFTDAGTSFDINDPLALTPTFTHASPSCFDDTTATFVSVSVPEPTSLIMFAVVIVMGFSSRRRK